MTASLPSPRRSFIERKTRETRIRVELVLDGSSQVEVETGLGFLDHMITTLAFHAGFNLTLSAEGDVHVDDHHTVEDCFLALGDALRNCLSERAGVRRFGAAYAPLDEALARAVIDLSGRPHATVELGLRRERLGEVACENLTHALRSLAIASQNTLHVEVLRGENDHHRVEAAFKATALALREAITPRSACASPGENETLATTIPSTKGSL